MQAQEFRDYLLDNDMTILDFCKLIDCNPKYFSRLLHNHLYAGKRLANDVRYVTDGRVNLRTRPFRKKYELKKPREPWSVQRLKKKRLAA